MSTITTVLTGTSVSYGIHRWRSGEFTLFLDVLGLAESHPLVEHVRSLPGVRLRSSRKVVTAVEIGSDGHRPERFAAFIDGMSADPVRTDVKLGAPFAGEHDDVREFAQGWITVHAGDRQRISRITVSHDPPRR